MAALKLQARLVALIVPYHGFNSNPACWQFVNCISRLRLIPRLSREALTGAKIGKMQSLTKSRDIFVLKEVRRARVQWLAY